MTYEEGAHRLTRTVLTGEPALCQPHKSRHTQAQVQVRQPAQGPPRAPSARSWSSSMMPRCSQSLAPSRQNCSVGSTSTPRRSHAAWPSSVSACARARGGAFLARARTRGRRGLMLTQRPQLCALVLQHLPGRLPSESLHILCHTLWAPRLDRAQSTELRTSGGPHAVRSCTCQMPSPLAG